MASTFDSAPATALIASAMTGGPRLTELPEAQRPRSLAEGYDIQDRLAAEGAAGKAGREMPAGWKLGLGSRNGMKAANIDRPLIGRVFKGRLVPNGSEIACPAGSTGMIEIEIAVTLGRDVAPGDTLTNPMEAVESANLVSEIVLSRFVDRRVIGLPTFAADSVGFHALVIGPKVATSDMAAIANSVKVTLDGKEAAGTLTGDDAIDPVEMLGFLFAHARDRGITLKKGEIVTTGTLSKPFDAPLPSSIEARTAGGSVAFKLKSA